MSRHDDLIRDLVDAALNRTPQEWAAMKAAAEAEARARPGPWRWYCRLCGTEGESPTERGRDDLAGGHLAATRCGRHPVTGWETSGKLLHVWTFPASAVAETN